MSKQVYGFLRENKLTDKDFATFQSEYQSDPAKVAQLHKFFTDNELTTKPIEEFTATHFSKQQAQSTPPQAQAQPTTSPQAPTQVEAPQDNSLFKDEETQDIYDDMDSYNPDQIRDMSMAVETGVAPVEQAPQSPENLERNRHGISYINKQALKKPPKFKSEQEVIADANDEMKRAVKFFADEYIGETNINLLIDPKKIYGDSGYTDRANKTLQKLSDEIQAIDNKKNISKEDNKKRINKNKQRNQVIKVISMMESKLGPNGELIPNRPGKGNNAIDNAMTSGRQERLAEETTGTKAQAFFPSLSQAIRDDEGFASEAFSAIGDIGRIPGNVVAGWVSSGDLWGEKLFQHMGIKPSDKRTRDRIIGEIGNALNYVAPSGKAAVSGFKGAVSKYSLARQANRIPRPNFVTKSLGKPIPGESSLFDTGVRKGANLLDEKVVGKTNVENLGSSLAIQEGSKGLLKSAGEVAKEGAGFALGKVIDIGSKLLQAGIQTQYAQAPETIVRSLEYLTDKDDMKGQLLLELISQTVLGVPFGLKGKFAKQSTSEASRIQKLYDSGDYNMPTDIQKQLEDTGFSIKQQSSQDTMQGDEIVELANLMKSIYSDERFKELNRVMGGTEADVTDLIKTLESRMEAKLGGGQYKVQYNAAKEQLESLKALVKNRGRTTVDYKIGEKQINDTGLMEDVVVTSDISSTRTLAKAREDADWELGLENIMFDNLKSVNTKINKLTEDLSNIRSSDFQKTVVQIVGGKKSTPSVNAIESIESNIASLKEELSSIDISKVQQKLDAHMEKGYKRASEPKPKKIEAEHITEYNVKQKALKDELALLEKEANNQLKKMKPDDFKTKKTTDTDKVKGPKEISEHELKYTQAQQEIKESLKRNKAELKAKLAEAKREKSIGDLEAKRVKSEGDEESARLAFEEKKLQLKSQVDEYKAGLDNSIIELESKLSSVKGANPEKMSGKESVSRFENPGKGVIEDVLSPYKRVTRTETDFDAMAKAKSDIQSDINKELEGAGAAGLDGGKNAADIMSAKSAKIESLEKNIDDLTPDIVEGSERYYLPIRDYNEKYGQVGDITFDQKTSSIKNSDKSKALSQYVYGLMKENLTKGKTPDDAKIIDQMMDELATFNRDIAPLFSIKGGIDKGVDTIEKRLNKFVNGGKSDEVMAVLAEFSQAYKSNRKIIFANQTKGMDRKSGAWRIANEKYKKDIKRMDVFGNAELNQLRSKLQTILDGKKFDKTEVPSLKIAKINKAVFTSQGTLKTLGKVFLKTLRASVKGSLQSSTKQPEKILEAWQSALDKLDAYDSGEEIDPIDKSLNYVDEEIVSPIKDGVEEVKSGLNTVNQLVDQFGNFLPSQSKKKSEKLDAYKSSKEYKTLTSKEKKTTDDYFDYARSIGQNVKSDVVFKSPKPIIKQIMLGMNSTYKKLGITSQPAITSAEDSDDRRPGYDRHEKGNALDYRLNDLDKATQKKLIKGVANKYKNNPNIDVEAHGKGQNYHLHIELHPK